MANLRKAGLLFTLLTLLSFALAQEQYGDQIREYMRDNKADFFVALDAIGTSYQDAVDALARQDITETSLLNYVFADCVVPTVFLQGSAEEIGTIRENLIDFALLRLRNDLSNLSICTSSITATHLHIYLTVWTVGTDYPVAYHVNVTTRILGGGLSNSYEAYTDSALGYSNAKDVESQVKTVIESIISDLSIDYYKGIGDF